MLLQIRLTNKNITLIGGFAPKPPPKVTRNEEMGGRGMRIMDLDQYLEKMITNTKII